MKFQVYAQVEIRDKKGKLLRRTRKKLCHSYVQQLIDWLRSVMTQGTDNVNDVGGTPRAMETHLSSSGAGYSTGAVTDVTNDDNYGILVGSSNVAVAIGQYTLVTKILNGATSGKLSYGAVSVGVCATVSTTRQFTIARTFTNNSGADITVQEIGLIMKGYVSTSAYYAMIERSLLNFTITNGTSGTVTYTISATV